MTEAEWLACTEPDAMLSALLRIWNRPSNRKLRLFACACCRHVPALISGELALATVETVEQYADGLVTNVDLGKALTKGWSLRDSHWRTISKLTPRNVEAVRSDAAALAVDGLAERQYQAEILRDVFGLRKRGPLLSVIQPAWRTSDVLALARGMYESRDFSAVPVLADALQDAGCMNDDVLNHCRGDGPHVRGCWVVDLVLDKV